MPTILALFAQVVPKILPDREWWTDRGFLGVFAFVVIAVALITLREWWKIRRPHVIKKQEIEIQKEQRQSDLLDTLRLNEGQDQQHKSRTVVAIEKLTALTERLATTQEQHAHDCAVTRRTVETMASP